MEIRQAKSEDDLNAVRQLCRAYREVLAEVTADRPEILQTFYRIEDYEALLQALPQKHARPDGAIFLGIVDGAPMGCGMVHRIDAETCEIKRVYVSPEARGKGMAEAIVRAAMDQARSDGYARMVLDSIERLEPALRLYTRLGFTPCAPFYDVPPLVEDIVVFRGAAL